MFRDVLIVGAPATYKPALLIAGLSMIKPLVPRPCFLMPTSGGDNLTSENAILLRQRTDESGPTLAADRLAGALKLVATGDRIAFEEVYRRSSAKLFGVCLRIVSGQREAEDALQDAYCAVWRGAAGFDARRGTAMTWLMAIARNCSVDLLRKSTRIVMMPIEHANTIPDLQASAFELLAAECHHQRMTKCLRRLAARDVQSLKAAFFDGATYADLATAADIPVGTMKSRIRRALAQLRRDMEES